MSEEIAVQASGKNTTDKPSGKFAEIGGIERRPAHSFETPEKPVDFSHLGGERVGSTLHDAPESKEDDND